MKVLISVLLIDFICLFMHIYFSKRKLRNNHAYNHIISNLSLRKISQLHKMSVCKSFFFYLPNIEHKAIYSYIII